jgi:hypothetical protein
MHSYLKFRSQELEEDESQKEGAKETKETTKGIVQNKKGDQIKILIH